MATRATPTAKNLETLGAARPADIALGKATFYSLWRQTIVRYGVLNPYTGRGAISGLLPHGPHGVRDVLATHGKGCLIAVVCFHNSRQSYPTCPTGPFIVRFIFFSRH